jgi:hypothetical protein
MKYSRVALLLALVLVGRTADAWVIDSQLLMPCERVVLAPLSSMESSQQAKASQHSAFWLADDLTGADGPNARAEEKLGIDQRLAALFQSGISLVKSTNRRTIAYVSLYWKQAIEYCRDYSVRGLAGSIKGDSPIFADTKIGTVPAKVVEDEKVGVDLRATLDNLVKTIRIRYASQNQNRVDDRLRSLDLIECLWAGYLPSQGKIEPWYCVCDYEPPFSYWAYHERSPLGPSITSGLVCWAKTLVEDWEAAFRNTSHRFAQLNWTILLKDRFEERSAGMTMPATQ